MKTTSPVLGIVMALSFCLPGGCGGAKTATTTGPDGVKVSGDASD